MAEKNRKRTSEKKPDSKSKPVKSSGKSITVSPSQNSQEQKTVPKLQNEKFQPFPQTTSAIEDKISKKSDHSQQIIKQYSSISPQSPKKDVSEPRSKRSSEIQTQSQKSNSESSVRLRNKVDPIKKIEDEYEGLTTLEKFIIEIAKTVLKKKRYEATITTQRPENMSPLVEELHERCIAKLTYTRGYSREEIFETIQKLHEERWIITDQRRTRKEILGSGTLKEVLDFIHKNPGTHARNENIKDELSITRNPFIKHVMVLEAFGLIRSKKIGRTLNYFVTDFPEKFDDLVVLFANPMVPEIIFEFLNNDNVSLSEIARKLDVYHGAIQYHVKKLKSMEIMIEQDDKWSINRKILEEYNLMFDIPPFTSAF